MPPPILLRLRHLRHLSTATATATATVTATATTTSTTNPRRKHNRRIKKKPPEPTTTTVTESSSSSPKPTTISLSLAKHKLRTQKDPEKALQIYSSLSDHHISSSRYAAQELTVRRLAKGQRFDDIESLIESLKRDPQIKEESFLSTLIRSYGHAGMFDHALRTYQQMDELGTPRSVISFNALLFACIQSKRFEDVLNLFEEMPEKYASVVFPDKVSYGILVKSYCEMGLPEKGLEVLKLMGDKNVEVTTVTYTTILNSLYKKGMLDDAERLWDEMVANRCELDVAAYNVRIMNAFGVDVEKVKEMIMEMGNLGLKPDAISYNYLMTCYCENGNMEEARKMYEGLEAYGCKPNAATFRILIDYLCRAGLYERGYKLFKESVRVRKIPDFGTMKCLVEGLVKRKKSRDAKGLCRTLKKNLNPSLLNAWAEVEKELGLLSAAVPEQVPVEPSVTSDEDNIVEEVAA